MTVNEFIKEGTKKDYDYYRSMATKLTSESTKDAIKSFFSYNPKAEICYVSVRQNCIATTSKLMPTGRREYRIIAFVKREEGLAY